MTGYDASYTYFNNLGPNSAELAELFKNNLAAYWSASARASSRG